MRRWDGRQSPDWTTTPSLRAEGPWWRYSPWLEWIEGYGIVVDQPDEGRHAAYSDPGMLELFSDSRRLPADLYPSELRFLPWLAGESKTVLDMPWDLPERPGLVRSGALAEVVPEPDPPRC